MIRKYIVHFTTSGCKDVMIRKYIVQFTTSGCKDVMIRKYIVQFTTSGWKDVMIRKYIVQFTTSGCKDVMIRKVISDMCLVPLSSSIFFLLRNDGGVKGRESNKNCSYDLSPKKINMERKCSLAVH